MIIAQCPVCQEVFTDGKDCVLSALPCGHVFHKHCIDIWFKTSCTCPQCRIEVKRASTIPRLYFDCVSTTTIQSVSSRYNNFVSSNDNGTPSGKHLNAQLHRARLENERLEEALRVAEERTKEQSELVNNKQKELLTLTSLYTESDRLCEKERQRCRELKAEVLSLKQFLREAEAMKSETIQLRREIEDMHNVKKLLAASEDQARELLSRYKFHKDKNSKQSATSDNDCNLESLCRWTAVLRSELTSAREKARNYRIELLRLRKLHQSVARRAAQAEASAAERVRILENDLSSVQTAMRLSDVAQLDTPTTSWSSVTSSPRPAVNGALSTPDLLSLSIQRPATVELQKKLRTPLENPFLAQPTGLHMNRQFQNTAFSTEFPSSSTPTRKASFKSGSQQSQSKFMNMRRPSILYEMAIMRRHLHDASRTNSDRNSYPAPSTSTAPPPTKPLPSHGTIRSKRPTSSLKSQIRMAKLSRLDLFICKP